MRTTITLFILFAVSMVNSVHPQTILVREGIPRAVIVLPSDPGTTLRTAADELQKHLEIMSGAQLEIVEDGDHDQGAAILLGVTGGLDLALTPVDIGYDGYVIQSDGDRIIITGRVDAGTLNGVYGFLQDHLGVRWYYPGPLGTHIPRYATISLDRISEINRPRFESRRGWYNGNCTRGYSDEEMADYRVWTRRMRGGGVRGYVGHYWEYTIPPDKYFAEHPEYFALIQGERRPLQLCTSNPEVIDIYTRSVLRRFTDDPDFRYASLSPNDGDGWCECDHCLAVSDDLTSRIVLFINEIARRVQPRFPDRRLAFYAYARIVSPPAEDIRLEPNVIPWLAHYSIDQVHSISDPQAPNQARYRRIVDGWRSIAEQIGVREYASWWPVPCVEARRVARDTSYYASMGALTMSREYLEVQFGTPLLMWVEHNLLWQPDQPLDELLDDFFATFYGPAGAQMREVYDSLAARKAAIAKTANYTGNAWEAVLIYPRATLAEAAARVRTIEARMDAGLQRSRVHREWLALHHARLWHDAFTADRQASAGSASAAIETAAAALSELIEFRDAMPDNHVVSRIARDWAAGRLALYNTSRTVITEPGQWGFVDDYNGGGSAWLDAEEIVGLTATRYGLSLGPGREGYIQYHFSTDHDLHFTETYLHSLFLLRNDLVQNRIEVQRGDGGPWQLVAENVHLNSWDHRYQLDEFINGADRFSLRIWGRNGSSREHLLLDNFGIRGQAVSAAVFNPD